MKLTVMERLALLGILPQEGNFATLKLVRELREEFSFDEKEHKKLNLVQEGNKVHWDQSVDAVKDCAIGETMMTLIVETLAKLNEEKKLRSEHISLYEKFVLK